MTNTESLKITTPSDREIAMTRLAGPLAETVA